MSCTLCTSGAIITKAGSAVSSTAKTSGAILAEISDGVEGYINGMTRFDWVTNYASVGANFKPMLATAAACLAANDLILYDRSGYMTSEAQDLININYDRAMNAIKSLIDEKLKTKMGVSNQ